MSRIGCKKIKILDNVQVDINNDIRKVKIAGKHGTITIDLPKDIFCEKKENYLFVQSKGNSIQSKANWGTIRALINNAIIGVSQLFKKELELRGNGYRAEKKGNNLILHIGYANPVVMLQNEGVNISCPAPNKIIVEGPRKDLVGKQAADIRNVRKPNPYSGNGIIYAGERLILRQGKKQATSSGSGAKKK